MEEVLGEKKTDRDSSGYNDNSRNGNKMFVFLTTESITETHKSLGWDSHKPYIPKNMDMELAFHLRTYLSKVSLMQETIYSQIQKTARVTGFHNTNSPLIFKFLEFLVKILEYMQTDRTVVISGSTPNFYH